MELWLLYAIGAAIFATLTTILAKVGIKQVNSHLATAIRTIVVLVFAWLIVGIVGSYQEINQIARRTWLFLILSGLATGASWLCYFRALKLGDVNKVVPIDKSSTILTMLLAVIFLNEPAGLITVIGMVLMGGGTWLMLDLKKNDAQAVKAAGSSDKQWLFFAGLSAIFASLTAIFGRVGVVHLEANLWTAIRTIVVIPLSLAMVLLTGSQKELKTIATKSWIFLVLSGVSTGVSWLFFYHALQVGHASHVVPIEKLNILLTMGFAKVFLGERFSKRSLCGLALLTVGTLLPIFW